MADVLICSDAEWVHDEVRSVLSATGDKSRSVYEGVAVRPAVAKQAPDLVVLDFQVGSMGGMATCLDLRLEEAAGRLPRVPVLMLLDRRADVFLARRSEAEGWVVKPLDPIRMRKAITALLAGGIFHDASFRPVPVVVGEGGAAPGDTARTR
ncbi:MAG TPA: response regulator [Actinomycetota bacterium]|nr:response regulator [Actinomycetota bacterium]